MNVHWGAYEEALNAAFHRAEASRLLPRIWDKDPAAWNPRATGPKLNNLLLAIVSPYETAYST